MALPKIPIDIKMLAKASEVFESESSSSNTIEVLVDTTASRALVSLSRRVLKVTSSAVEINITSFSTEMPKLSNEASLIIVIAGTSRHMRRIMEIALWSGLRCVVLAEDAPSVVATVEEEDMLEIAKAIIEVDVNKPQEVLEHDLASWCINNLPDLRLSLGTAFPFMRHPIALDLTRQTTLENAIIAAVFFLPGADLPVLTLNQCKLFYQIAVINEVPLTRDRLVEVALIVASAFGFRGINRLAQRKLAPVGWLVRSAVAAGATLLMGHLAYLLYSSGGGIVDLIKELGDGGMPDGTGAAAEDTPAHTLIIPDMPAAESSQAH